MLSVCGFLLFGNFCAVGGVGDDIAFGKEVIAQSVGCGKVFGIAGGIAGGGSGEDIGGNWISVCFRADAKCGECFCEEGTDVVGVGKRRVSCVCIDGCCEAQEYRDGERCVEIVRLVAISSVAPLGSLCARRSTAPKSVRRFFCACVRAFHVKFICER